MGKFNESILHTVGRAVGSGAWQGMGARAVQAFQNAKALKYNRENQLAQQGLAQEQLGLQEQKATWGREGQLSGQDFRNHFTGPVLRQNAASRSLGAQTGAFNAVTKGRELNDRLSGGQAARDTFKNIASRNVTPADAPGVLGAYQPDQPGFGLQSPNLAETLQGAQDRKKKYDIQLSAGKTGAANRQIGERQAGKSLFDELTGAKSHHPGLGNSEFDRRKIIEAKSAVAKKMISEGANDEEIHAALDQIDMVLQSMVQTSSVAR